MIPVKPTPEPPDFDKKVRQPGKKWLANPKNANVNPSNYKNYWTKCIPDLASSYNHMCAYLAECFPSAFGADSVDHFVPKSDPINGKNLAYEWSNYRLSSIGANRKKNNKISPIDPFTMQPDSFFIDFSDGHIFPNPAKTKDYKNDCLVAIDVLLLNMKVFCDMRLSRFNDYVLYDLPDAYMRKYSPFVWSEICRQGLKK